MQIVKNMLHLIHRACGASQEGTYGKAHSVLVDWRHRRPEVQLPETQAGDMNRDPPRDKDKTGHDKLAQRPGYMSMEADKMVYGLFPNHENRVDVPL